jgi:peptidoglycan hydrolase CwlO-like protein
MRIDELVQEESAKLLALKNSLKTDIARLQNERAEWEERIRKLEEEHDKVRDETSKVVKAAFEKARTQGVARLAEVAIFQALSTPTNVAIGTTQNLPVRSASIAQPNVRNLDPSDGDVISTLRTLGVVVSHIVS